MGQEEGVQGCSSISNSPKPGAVVSAPGMQPPCTGQAGVDVQAGVVKRMHATGQQLEEARLQAAYCRCH